MSREIMFRIWDNDKDEWLSQSDDDALTYYGFHLIGECMTVQSPSKWTVNGTVEQYTGLKDKNGKEIYEGDIVYDIYTGDEVFIVSWDKDKASFMLADTADYPMAYFDEYKPGKDLEVIGNIHENPELLGGEEC